MSRRAGLGPSQRPVFTQSPVALLVLDDQLRVVRVNTAVRGLRDTLAGHLLGKQFTEAYELEDPEEEGTVARRVLESRSRRRWSDSRACHV
ncbi:PAS domain-containing protein [Streptomyces sp. RB6PN25]|uniref:PAS domain-containing protein n=1 Tax=Streptomyces humicola TaxID=2953240 RepID=A0ABT1PW19_9ACTN|nr:PAS domain-containing protein [Streptomyces humicola]MCQ4081323.1 PAS domain-containing protein [Streptomyces humicola]